MANFKTSGDIINDIANELEKLSEDISEQLGQKMLDEGAKIIELNWIKAIKKHKLVDTGDMVNSVGVAKGTKTKKFRDVYPQGKDRKGVRNAEKAFIAHYGKSGQLGNRFVDEAEANADVECADSIQKILDDYIEKKGM